MPLKEPDLKDTDTYKKASRVDLPKVVSGNAKFWIYKDVELPNASGKKQKFPVFLALVDDNGIRKAMAGKKLICKGTCGIKEDRIAFEATTGTVPYKLLKTSVPLLLGKAVWIPTGMEEEGEEEEVGQSAAAGSSSAATQSAAPPAPAAPPPPPQTTAPSPAQAPATAPSSAAALTGEWTKLVKDVQAYAAAHPERKADLFRDMTAIGALLKANQAAEAKSKMDKIQAALGAPPAAAPAGPASQQQIAARWGALVKEMQAIVAAHPEKKAELVRMSAGIQDSIRSGKLDIATKQLEAVEQALKENPREKEYRARYQAIEGRLAAALKDPGRDAGGLRAMNAFVVEKANAGEFETAWKALLKLEEALAAKPAAAAGASGPAADKAREEEEASEAEDGEEEKEAEEFQKDLKGKMVTALAQVRARAPRQGETPKPQLRFMAYLAGNRNAVIVAKKVGSASKRLLAEIAGAGSGKIVLGECIFEKGVHTFLLESVPSGLAKKLTKALLAETGARYRVRVRSMDGSVDLDSETDIDPDTQPDETPGAAQARWSALVKQLQAAVQAHPEKKADLVRASAGIQDMIRAANLDQANKLMDGVDAMLAAFASGDTASNVNSDGQADWEKRFAEIEPRYLDVLKTQPANASDMRAAMSSANTSAENRDFAGAVATLGHLEALLEAAKTLGKETDVIPEGIVERTVAQLDKVSSQWREVHFKSVEGLESLMKRLRAEEDTDLHEIADHVDRLTKDIPSEIEAALSQLSAAVQGGNAGETAKWAKQVELGVETCTSYLNENLPAIYRCEQNPFDVPVMIQEPLRETLADIRAALADLSLSAA